MLQHVEYLTLPLIRQHFWAENILKVPTNGKGITDDNLTPCKLSILRENTYDI